MNDYYLRCRQSRLSVLIDRGVRMGAIEIDKEGNPMATEGGCWDFIGKKVIPWAEGEPMPEPVGGKVDPFIHINLRTPVNLRESAVKLAKGGDADIAKGLVEIATYFITDDKGNIISPEFPLRVFL